MAVGDYGFDGRDNMKKQLLIIGLIAIILSIVLSGCNENTSKSDENKLIGIWTYSIDLNNETISLTYDFLINKTFKMITSSNDEVLTVNGTWNIKDNKLLIALEGQDTMTNDYEFSDSDTKLNIKYEGFSMIFIKQ